MTESPSEAQEADAAPEAATAAEAHAGLIAAVGGRPDERAHESLLKVIVEADRWVEAVAAARDQGFDFFAFLSAVDYTDEVAVGDPFSGISEDAPSRYEILCRLSNVTDGEGIVLTAVLDRDEPAIDSLVPVFGGAEWHEREAHEMFGIDFRGHPRLIKLYLPDAFEGHPLRKSYPLLSREVKPWPGLVDVEGMPASNGDAPDGGPSGGDE